MTDEEFDKLRTEFSFFSHDAPRLLRENRELRQRVLDLEHERESLKRIAHGTIADRLFSNSPAENELHDNLDEIFGEGFVDDVSWDSYDASLEVYLENGFVYGDVHIDACLTLGFSRVWIHAHPRDLCPRRRIPMGDCPELCHHFMSRSNQRKGSE